MVFAWHLKDNLCLLYLYPFLSRLAGISYMKERFVDDVFFDATWLKKSSFLKPHFESSSILVQDSEDPSTSNLRKYESKS